MRYSGNSSYMYFQVEVKVYELTQHQGRGTLNPTMEEFRQFLESSTIHGLYFISTAKKWSRFFWIMVVFVGFIGAGVIIQTSFHNWEQSPIVTTIETLPIYKLTFPNITVCPPKDSYLNLNYDILNANKTSLDNESRENLIQFAMEVFQNEFYDDILSNLSKLKDPDLYYNWYHGYSLLQYPSYDPKYENLIHKITTSATSGNISTAHFGEMFDAEKVDGNIDFQIEIKVPNNSLSENITLMYNVEKHTIKEFSNNDQFNIYLGYNNGEYYSMYNVDADLGNVTKNITNPNYSLLFNLQRKVTKESINSLKMKHMPGLRLTWKYNKNVAKISEHKQNSKNEQFLR